MLQLRILTSTVNDGTMKQLAENDRGFENRKTFLHRHDVSPSNATLVRITYGGDDYCRYATLDDTAHGNGIIGMSTLEKDALVVTRPSHALVLPLADCVGAVLYDPKQHILMVSHLGRHSLEQNGGFESVRYLETSHHCDPALLTVWLSPAASKVSYPLHAFDNKSLREVAREQLTQAGILSEHIETSPVHTTTDETYFSHSEFLRGNRVTDGRFTIVALME